MVTSRLRSAVGLLALGACLLRTASAQLPQDYPDQVVLRNYLSEFTETDFVVDLEPVLYVDAFADSIEALHRLWILLEDRGRKMPAHTGLRVAPALFTLESIERPDGVYMQVGRNSRFFDPIDTAWWISWNYPGNPYFGHAAGWRRAFVAATVDLLMTERSLDTAPANLRSDYIGGYLTRAAYVYHVVRDSLPDEVREAYGAGLRRLVDRLLPLYPTGSGGADMETFQLAGLWYAAESLDDNTLRTAALERSRYVLDTIMNGDGHFHEHGVDGVDLSYEGIAQRFVAWAAMVYDDPVIDGYLEKSARLKAYQTLPEPDGTFLSPSHFNTGTAGGSSEDQWHTYQRDHAVAMRTDEAKYLVWTGRTLPAWYFQGLPDQAQMQADIALAIAQRNADTDGSAGWAWTAPSPVEPALWTLQHWIEGIPAATLFPAGFYDTMAALEAGDDRLTRPPFQRDEAFVETFGDDFVAINKSGYGAILHTGTTVGAWANGVPGLSGGALSAFWTPEAGTVILGRSRGAQNAAPDTWTGPEGWDTWAVHALSGVSASGLPFSSARHRHPKVSRSVDGTRVSVAGAIGPHDAGRSAPNGAIVGQVAYSRTYTAGVEGLSVVSTLTADGVDLVAELWEILPFYLRDNDQAEADARIEWRVGAVWLPADTVLQASVSAVRTTRHGASVQLEFDAPRRVKLGPAVWTSPAVGSRIRNVMIDLLGSDGQPVPLPAETSVSYTIGPAPVVVPGDASGNGAISALDAAMILEHVAGQRFLSGDALVAADASGNGLVSPLDASFILQLVVGVITCVPAAGGCP
jgi:hypothetical protein